jgi:hypothetical protein
MMTVRAYHPVPDDVYAVKVDGESVEGIAAWCGGSAIVTPRHAGVRIPEVGRIAWTGDYVVENKYGDFYVMGAFEFEMSYEEER